MTDREKLLDILKAAYEPRKIPQEDGSVACRRGAPLLLPRV